MWHGYWRVSFVFGMDWASGLDWGSGIGMGVLDTIEWCLAPGSLIFFDVFVSKIAIDELDRCFAELCCMFMDW